MAKQIMREIPGTEFEIACDLCLIAIGFSGPEPEGIVHQLQLELDSRGNIVVDQNYQTTIPGVYSAGDCRKGQRPRRLGNQRRPLLRSKRRRIPDGHN